MACRKLRFASMALLLVTMTSPAYARLGPRQRMFWQRGHGGRGHGHSFGQGLPFFGGFAVGGFYYAYSPFFVIGPGAFIPPPPLMMMPPGFGVNEPLLAPPPAGFFAPPLRGNLRPANFRRSDSVRAGQLVTVGDRLFRAGNLKKAEERYQQAVRTAPDLASPRVRLAQLALARANYQEAANRLREAESAEPGWLVTAPDIQAIFGEPTDFSRLIGRLETYLQVHPDDRDAWLVLGAEWFLSGRTAKAADVFKRLDDPKRKRDIALAAFLDASNQAVPKPANPRDPDAAPAK